MCDGHKTVDEDYAQKIRDQREKKIQEIARKHLADQERLRQYEAERPAREAREAEEKRKSKRDEVIGCSIAGIVAAALVIGGGLWLYRKYDDYRSEPGKQHNARIAIARRNQADPLWGIRAQASGRDIWIHEVLWESPAFRAQLSSVHRITRVNGVRVKSVKSLEAALRASKERTVNVEGTYDTAFSGTQTFKVKLTRIKLKDHEIP